MPVYDFSTHHDRLAYLLTLPKRELVAVWGDRFEQQYGAQAAEQLREGLREIYAKKPR